MTNPSYTSAAYETGKDSGLVPTPKEAGLCVNLEEANKYADEMYEILGAIEIKLRRGPEKVNGPAEIHAGGAIGNSRVLAQKLAGLIGFAKSLDRML